MPSRTSAASLLGRPGFCPFSAANMPVVLHYLDGASPCLFVRSVAKHIGLEIDIKDVDYYTKEHLGEKYLKINPFHKMPAIDDGGFILYESNAIAYYLVRKYAPQSDLYPGCVKFCARIDQTLAALSSTIHPQAVAFTMGRFFLHKKPTDQETAAYEENVLRGIEKLLGGGKFAAGDKLSLADLAVFAYLAIALEIPFVDTAKFPELTGYYQRVKAMLPYFEEVYRPAIAHAQKGWKMMK
ncbi:glutathione S-transferase 1-like [Haemaphysalis longicornis]